GHVEELFRRDDQMWSSTPVPTALRQLQHTDQTRVVEAQDHACGGASGDAAHLQELYTFDPLGLCTQILKHEPDSLICFIKICVLLNICFCRHHVTFQHRQYS